MIWEERVKAERAAERANRPKKHVPKKEEYEVEAIKGKTRSVLGVSWTLSIL